MEITAMMMGVILHAKKNVPMTHDSDLVSFDLISIGSSRVQQEVITVLKNDAR